MSNYEQAVAREEENRLLAYVGRGRPVLGFLLVNLTWRHCLELSLARNAFFTELRAERGDVFDFLWRLHPHFRTIDGRFPNVRHGAKPPSRLRSAFAAWRIALFVRRVDLVQAELAILQWIRDAYQDKPADDTDGDDSSPKPTASALSARLNWFDWISSQHGDRALDLGVAVSFQILRAQMVARGEGARCIPPSAALKRFDR